jgi:hypothetical protein
MDVREQIRAYLDDPETLYKDWYLEQSSYKAGIDFGEEVGALADWKKAFINWVQTHLPELRHVICPNASKIEAAATQIDMVLEILDLIEEQPYVGTVKRTATLLLLYGIEKLCEDYEP